MTEIQNNKQVEKSLTFAQIAVKPWQKKIYSDAEKFLATKNNKFTAKGLRPAKSEPKFYY